MRVTWLPGLLWSLLLAAPLQAGCEGMVGDTVQVSDRVVEAEILNSGDN